MCDYCNDNGIEILNTREESEHNRQYRTGFEVYIYQRKLKIYACLDKPNIHPVCDGVVIPIKFCPMCGHDLTQKEPERMTPAENKGY